MTNIMTSSFQWNIPTFEFQAWSTQQPDSLGAWFPISASSYTSGTENVTGTWSGMTLVGPGGGGGLDVDEVGTYTVSGTYVINQISSQNGGLGVSVDEIVDTAIDVGFSVSAPTGTDVTFSMAVVDCNRNEGAFYLPNTNQSNGPVGIILTGSTSNITTSIPSFNEDASDSSNLLWVEDPDDLGVWKVGGSDSQSGALTLSNAPALNNAGIQMYPFGTNGDTLIQGVQVLQPFYLYLMVLLYQ